jgi:hypothetical protein
LRLETFFKVRLHMKRCFAYLLALMSAATFAATTTPVSLLNPSGSTVGQAIISTGPSSAPVWGSVPLTGITGTLAVGNGGTGASTLTAHGVLVGEGTAAVTAIGPGANGQMLLGVTGSDPYWGTNPAISGATIDNSPIGNVTASSGKFTTISATGAATFSVRPTFNGNTPVDSGNVLTAVPGRLLNVQVFTSSGTYTPTAGATKAIVEVMAPGGGSGGNPATNSTQTAISSPGNAGAYAKIWIASGLTTQTVTIGAVGAAGTSAPTAGGTGGTTSFGSLVSCLGSADGPAGTATATTTSFTTYPSATASTCSGTGTFLVSGTGAAGEKGFFSGATPSVLFPGSGASTMWGQGGQGRTITPAAGTGYGAGAGAFYQNQSSAAAAGAAGAPGIVIVYELN